jgi:hypothetical protein
MSSESPRVGSPPKECMATRTTKNTQSTARLTKKMVLTLVRRKATSKGVTVAVNSSANTITMSQRLKKAFCTVLHGEWWSVWVHTLERAGGRGEGWGLWFWGWEGKMLPQSLSQ